MFTPTTAVVADVNMMQYSGRTSISEATTSSQSSMLLTKYTTIDNSMSSCSDATTTQSTLSNEANNSGINMNKNPSGSTRTRTSKSLRHNNIKKTRLPSIAACLTVVALHQVVTPVQAFIPALSSPLFVNTRGHKGQFTTLSPASSSASSQKKKKKNGVSASSSAPSSTLVATSASSSSINNSSGDQATTTNPTPPYVPASLYAADSNDQRYSASDWYHNMKTLPSSSILKEIKGPIWTIALWSGFWSFLHKALNMSGMKGAAQAMCMSSKPHSFLVSALGLLLVFRTNSAYQRFAEGRQIWEKILSVSRNMSRMVSLYEDDLGPECKQRVFRLLSAFPYLLRHHIQPQCLDCNKIENSPYAILLREESGGGASALLRNNRRNNIKKPSGGKKNNLIQKAAAHNTNHECWVDRRSLPWCLLPDAALAKCAVSDNRPLWICDRLSQELTSVEYTPNFTSRERLSFLGHVDKLSQCIGECERIHQTAVPLNYARHSLRSLTLWLFSLPFCLLDDLGILTGPVMAAMAWLLLGVYQIGYSIEDPFQGSLRLSVLCDAVYRDVMYIGRLQENPRDSAYELEEEQWDAMEDFSGDGGAAFSNRATNIPQSLIGAAP